MKPTFEFYINRTKYTDIEYHLLLTALKTMILITYDIIKQTRKSIFLREIAYIKIMIRIEYRSNLSNQTYVR